MNFRAAHAYAAALTLQVSPHAGEAGEQILILGQLHLGAGVGRACTLGEDVENEAGAVEHFYFQLFFYVGHLLRSQIVVEYGHGYIVVLGVLAYLLQFARSHECARVGAVHFLCELTHRHSPRCVGQKFKFVEIFIGASLVLGRCDKSYEYGAFG